VISYCSRCGARREAGRAFCPSCGAPFDRPVARRRRGRRASTGLLLALLGGAWLFVPFWPSSLGGLSLWQSRDVCSSVLGLFAASECSTITLLWAAGLGLIGLGTVALLGAALGSEPAEPTPPPLPRPSEPTQPPLPRPSEPSAPPFARPPEPSPTDATSRAPTVRTHGPRDSRRPVTPAVLGLIAIVGGVVLAANVVSSLERPADERFGVADPDPRAGTPSSAAVSVDVPVIPCATTYGNGDIQRPQPPSATMTLPGSLVGRVALFATNDEAVVAPLEFRCIAEVGANGSAGLTAASYDDSAAVIAQNAASSYGTILELACPLFPEAATLARQEFGWDCPTPPPGEVVTREGAIAYFEDPTGVVGTGDRSGADLGAIGAIAFVGGDAPSAMKITCLLPNDDRDLCQFAVSNWLSSFPSVPSVAG